MTQIFANFDFESFWNDSPYARKEYTDDPLTDELLASVEKRLGRKLPASYVELSRVHNGGIPHHTRHRTATRTTWAEDHVAITGIYSIGDNKPCSLCGEFGSAFWGGEWGYPDIGVYFADCPSAGHDMLCLDYSQPGPDGEPKVVHVDQEANYRATVVAPNFENFIRGLQDEDRFDI